MWNLQDKSWANEEPMSAVQTLVIWKQVHFVRWLHTQRSSCPHGYPWFRQTVSVTRAFPSPCLDVNTEEASFQVFSFVANSFTIHTLKSSYKVTLFIITGNFNPNCKRMRESGNQKERQYFLTLALNSGYCLASKRTDILVFYWLSSFWE